MFLSPKVETVLVVVEIVLAIVGYTKRDEVFRLVSKVATTSLKDWECVGEKEKVECNEIAYAWDSIQVLLSQNLHLKYFE